MSEFAELLKSAEQGIALVMIDTEEGWPGLRGHPRAG
jgi:hypothetical protein